MAGDNSALASEPSDLGASKSDEIKTFLMTLLNAVIAIVKNIWTSRVNPREQP